MFRIGLYLGFVTFKSQVFDAFFPYRIGCVSIQFSSLSQQKIIDFETYNQL